AVALAHLARTDTHEPRAAHGIKNRGARGRELETVAVAARDERRAAAPLLRGGRRGDEIVGLVARRLGVGETAGGHQLGDNVELLDQRIVALAPALVPMDGWVAVGGLLGRAPAADDRRGAARRGRGAAACWQSRGSRPPAYRRARGSSSATHDRRGARRNRRRSPAAAGGQRSCA